jgi:hypothetical protein
MTIYDGYQPWQPGEWPTMLAIGDSWFWYPRNNLLEALARHALLKDAYQHMVCLGQNGALLSDYVDLPGGRAGSPEAEGAAGARSDAVHHGLSRQRSRQ